MSDDTWIKDERDHEYRMEQERTKAVIYRSESRKEAVQVVAVVVGIVAVITLVVAALWTEARSNRERLERESVRCAETGGTMLDLAQSGKTCFRIEEGDQ